VRAYRWAGGASRWASGRVRFRDKRFDEFVVVFGWLWCVGDTIFGLFICIEGWEKNKAKQKL